MSEPIRVRLRASLPAIAFAAFAACAAPALARPADTVRFGARIEIEGPIEGRLAAAGADVDVHGAVTGSANLAGAQVTASSAVGGDLRVAGGQVALAADVGADLWAAGGSVVLAPGTRVGGSTLIAGGSAAVTGRFGGPVSIRAGVISLGGEYLGDVDLQARSRIEILPGTSIAGRLRVRAPRPLRLDSSVHVGGGIEQRTDGGDWFAWLPSWSADGEPARMHRHRLVGGGWGALLASLAAGAITMAIWPQFTRRCGERAMRSSLRSMLFGLAVLVAVPCAVIALALTLIGIPLALLLALAYPLLLIAGYVLAAIGLGDRCLAVTATDHVPRLGWRIAALAAALVLLAMLRALPWFGLLVAFAALAIGCGALVLELARPRRSDAQPAA